MPSEFTCKYMRNMILLEWKVSGHSGNEFFKIYKICAEGIQPWKMKNTDIYWRRYKIQETLYVGQWRFNPLQSRHLGTSHSSICWLQPIHVQHSQVSYLLQAFHSVDHFQWILDHLWCICATLLFVLHSLHCPWKPSESREYFPWRNGQA